MHHSHQALMVWCDTASTVVHARPKQQDGCHSELLPSVGRRGLHGMQALV